MAALSGSGADRVCGTRLERASDDARADTWIVSDLHVPDDGGAVLERFEAMVRHLTLAAPTSRLWILGDLFDSWVGRKQLVRPAARAVTTALADATRAGVSVTVLHGNRDFQLDGHFAAASGARVVAGGLLARFGERRVLALHGDELCRRDVPYQRAKRVLRHPVTRFLVRSLPLALASRLSGSARKRSGMVMRSGDQTRFDPTADAVREAFGIGVDLLIFGHIHRPARGEFAPGQEYCILPAFDAEGIGLRHDATGLHYVDHRGAPCPDPAARTFS